MTAKRQEQLEKELWDQIERFSDLSYNELAAVFETVIRDLRAEPYERK